ncbi:MAG: hypothetical protein LUG88_04000 [Clostridia bacterium]|nr:hypothetical protein [Clostridia bacterium]
MPLQESKYKHNQSILKKYGYGDHMKLKLITMNVLRTAGVEDDTEYTSKCSVNDEKLDENISRAKSNIFELAYCNPWQWFFTGTLDAEKYNRENLEKYHHDFTRWIKEYNRYHGTKIKFLLIPELHKDGKSWHMHGFLNGLPVDHLKQFIIGDRMGKAIADKVTNGETVYNWTAYAKKFGFCDLETIRNPEAVSKYVTKYICKDLKNSVKELNTHLYYHSRGLNKAQTIKKGVFSAQLTPTYENEYCSVCWMDYSEELLDSLRGSFSTSTF